MQKHTKGPWIVVNGTVRGDQIASVRSWAHKTDNGIGSRLICLMKHPKLMEEDHANMSLIAKAPEMLGLLSEIIDTLPDVERLRNCSVRECFDNDSLIDIAEWLEEVSALVSELMELRGCRNADT